jgi:hypothetical protein
MHETLERDAKLTSESLVQLEKQPSQSIATENGKQIAESDEHFRNADGPIHETLEGDAKLT